MDFEKYKAKAQRNKAKYLPILYIFLVGFGVFSLFQLYQRWDMYDIANHICMGCIGIFSILLSISKKFRKFFVAIFLLAQLIVFLWFAIDSLLKGTLSVTASNVGIIIIMTLILGISSIFLLRNAIIASGRTVISIASVDLMDGPSFEHFCAQLLSQNGFKNVQLMGGSGDQGVDIIAKKHGIRYAIQCKCYSGNLDNTPVQEVFTGMAYYGCTAAAVMTNRYFTKGGIDLANSTGVLLWDRDWIYAHLKSGIRKPKKTGLDTEGAKKLDHPDLFKEEKEVQISDDFSVVTVGSKEHHPLIAAHASQNLFQTDPALASPKSETEDERLDYDPLLPEAIIEAVKTGTVSASMLQHRMKVGYSCADRLMRQMEEFKVVSPFDGKGPRKALISQDDDAYIRLCAIVKKQKGRQASDTKKSIKPTPLTEEEIRRIQGEELKWRRMQRICGSEDDGPNA